MTQLSDRSDPLAPYRGRLMGLAYRMLGSLSDAEDVLQDAYLRFTNIDQSTIRSMEGFLITMVTRLCLDRLKSAQAKREIYVGPWLPEPAPDAEALSPETALELADDLSFALLLVLERLSAPERAAFLLHDVFDKPFSEIAIVLGKSDAACRQLATRARKAVRDERRQTSAAPHQHQVLLQKFLEAAASGDPKNLEPLLTGDAISYSDGGGLKAAAINPIIGADKVARFFVGLVRKGTARDEQVTPVPTMLNGMPGILLYVNGVIDNAITIDVNTDKIASIYVVRNPEKLGALPERIDV